MTTYTTHMQIMTQIVAAQVVRAGPSSVSLMDAAALASRIISRSQEVAPIPQQQSRGPG